MVMMVGATEEMLLNGNSTFEALCFRNFRKMEVNSFLCLLYRKKFLSLQKCLVNCWCMDKNILEFVTFCVGAIAFDLKLSRNEVYGKLKRSGILDGYIVPSYDVLHTFSRPYIVSDIMDFMKEKGVLS